MIIDDIFLKILCVYIIIICKYVILSPNIYPNVSSDSRKKCIDDTQTGCSVIFYTTLHAIKNVLCTKKYREKYQPVNTAADV